MSEFTDLLRKSPEDWILPIEDEAARRRVPHGIYINGKRVRARNGKVVWWREGDAKNAFLNHLVACMPFIRYRLKNRSGPRVWRRENFDEIVAALAPEYIIEIKEIG